MSKILNIINFVGRSFDADVNYNDSCESSHVVFLGPPRSNSTYIHRLMSLHTEVFTPPLKELLFPGKIGSCMRGLFSSVPQTLINGIYNSNIHSTGANVAEADDIALLSAFSEGVFGWVYGGALKGVEKPTLNAEKHVSYLKWLHAYLLNKNQNKVIFSKYFAGIHHYADLKRHLPNTKYVLLSRDPELICYSLSTLVDSVLKARKLAPANLDQYWQNIYQFIVSTYRKIEQAITLSDEKLMIISDSDVKLNLNDAINRICSHSGLLLDKDSQLQDEINNSASRGTYEKKYQYNQIMEKYFNKNDFSYYYNREAGR